MTLISRKLTLICQGQYPWYVKDGVVPGSDGARTVEETGPRVTLFKKGDNVVTLFNQAHQAGSLTQQTLPNGLGGRLDGTFRQYGVFEETGRVSMPSVLPFEQASTLSCAGLTAWNAVYGLQDRTTKPGGTFQ